MKEKVTETVTFRTTLETKKKLTQNAEEMGKTLGGHCEDIISNFEESLEKQNLATQEKSILKEVYELVKELSKDNSELKEQVKTLTYQPKTVVEINNRAEQEKPEKENKKTTSEIVKLEESIKESLMEQIRPAVPVEEIGKFVERFKKMIDHRIKLGKDKSEAETIYKCIKYCMEVATFFDAG